MTRPPPPASNDKAERLAAALRENLKRRKAQARGRRDLATGPGEEETTTDTGAPPAPKTT